MPSNTLIRLSMILARAMHIVREAERKGPYEIRSEFKLQLTDQTLPMREFDRAILQPAIDEMWVRIEIRVTP